MPCYADTIVRINQMTVASSTHLTIKRDPGSNRCPLKVSLVGIAQDVMRKFYVERISGSDSSQVTPGFYSSVRSKLLSAHQSVCENPNKVSSDESLECVRSSVNSTINDCYSSKRARVEDESDNYVEHVNSTVDDYFSSKCTKVVDEEDDNVEYVDSCSSEDKRVVGRDKDKYYGENIILEDVCESSFSRNTNKGKGREFQPVVHNTRGRTKTAKSTGIKE
ncbi:hypothetical protein C2G38_2136461 [Gigaspora rosea]|uniref:Uncharacterized protein n=1 Tax=Gigaspora rosea TaxID=44941 RepID=A0A397W7X8_9GLOM|nr:hypothetical protein C2G38_2136461 [Gigaspora rosea]